MEDERQPVTRILGGDSAAFEVFVRRYQRLVGHVVFRLVANDSDREDIAQEVFMKVYRNLPKFGFESKVSTWVAQIAYNTCLNHLAKKRTPVLGDLEGENVTMADTAAPTAGPYEVVEAEDTLAHLQKAIAGLPVPYRTAVTLYHLEDMTYDEISRIMELPINTVKSHLFRARMRLRSMLTPVFQAEDVGL